MPSLVGNAGGPGRRAPCHGEPAVADGRRHPPRREGRGIDRAPSRLVAVGHDLRDRVIARSPSRFCRRCAPARTSTSRWPHRRVIHRGYPPRRRTSRSAERRQRATAACFSFFGVKGGAGTTTVAVNTRDRDRANVEEADAHHRPPPVHRRSGAVSRRAAALYAGRRARQPSPDRLGIPARARRQAQDRARHPRGRRAGRSPWAAGCRRFRTAAADAGPDLRLHHHRRAVWSPARARMSRCSQPTRSISWRIRTSPACATRTGSSTASASWAPAKIGSASCSTACPNIIEIGPKQIESTLGFSLFSIFPERLRHRLRGAELGRAADAEQSLGAGGAVRRVHQADRLPNQNATRLGASRARAPFMGLF